MDETFSSKTNLGGHVGSNMEGIIIFMEVVVGYDVAGLISDFIVVLSLS